ncbi:ATP-binding protein [Streptacidiphilus sp. N1-12]|uniref:ATP-binding protein n=2 Tax=Streptacidiphilus alkalitolerans TaxID=3342712 RepID=A0ABV6WEY0_9ACTN
MALVVARDVPTSSATMAVPHGPESVSAARRRLRKDLAGQQVPDVVIEDAVLILSELLSNACRHARPLEPLQVPAPILELVSTPAPAPASSQAPASATAPAPDQQDGSYPDDGRVVVGWELHSDGLLTVEVTDGGGPTRPRRGSPSLTARGGRGLGIVGQLASDWGVRDAPGEVTVWAVLPVRARHARRGDSEHNGAQSAV